MTPQANLSATTPSEANGHQNGIAQVGRSSIYDLLYAPDNTPSFYSSDVQRQNQKIGSAGCLHLMEMKNHQVIPNHSETRAIFQENLCKAVDYGIAWKLAINGMKTSKDEKTKSKKRKTSQDVSLE